MNNLHGLVSNSVAACKQAEDNSCISAGAVEVRLDRTPDALIEHIHALESELQTVREKSKFIAQELDLFRTR
ncbi:MAG: hypothetical protein IT342_08245, partial [Candidatus Melainabacteria bacterium]|nr:hypothetical protein [Candidatus Melainabacteria bacterium]